MFMKTFFSKLKTPSLIDIFAVFIDAPKKLKTKKPKLFHDEIFYRGIVFLKKEIICMILSHFSQIYICINSMLIQFMKVILSF